MMANVAAARLRTTALFIYNVSGCPRWHKKMHENLHFPGQDLTGELPDAPYREIVFQHPCVVVIGRLE